MPSLWVRPTSFEEILGLTGSRFRSAFRSASLTSNKSNRQRSLRSSPAQRQRQNPAMWCRRKMLSQRQRDVDRQTTTHDRGSTLEPLGWIWQTWRTPLLMQRVFSHNLPDHTDTARQPFTESPALVCGMPWQYLNSPEFRPRKIHRPPSNSTPIRGLCLAKTTAGKPDDP